MSCQKAPMLRLMRCFRRLMLWVMAALGAGLVLGFALILILGPEAFVNV